MAGVVIPITGSSASLEAATSRANAALNNMGNAAAAANAKVTAAAGATSSLGAAGSKAAAAMGPLGGILSKISPEAGAAAASIAGLSAAGQGLAGAATAAGLSMGAMAAAAGPVLVVVGLLAAVYLEYSKGLEATKRHQDALAEGHRTELSLLEQNKEAVRARLKEEGKWTATMQAATDAAVKRNKLEEESAPLLRDHALLQKEINEAVMDGTAIVTRHGKDTKDGARARMQALEEQLAANKALVESTIEEGATTAELADEKKKSDEATAKRDKEKAESDKQRAERLRKEAEELARVKAAVNAVAAAQKTLQDITHTASVSNMSALDKEDDAYHQKVLAIEAARDAALAAGGDEVAMRQDVLDAQTAAQQEHEANVLAIKQAARAEEEAAYEQFLDKQADADKQALDAAKQAAQDRLSNAQAVGAAIISLGDRLVDATTKQYDTTTAAGRKAAISQFNTQKAVHLASAIVAGALAVQNALASGPPPYNFIMAGITGIAAAVEIGVVASAQPKFHMGKRPDEFNATLQNGEAVVTSQGMSKPGMKEAVAAANAGQSVRSTSSPAVIQFRHKVYNRFMRENLRAGGPLADKFAQGKKIGHREVRQ